jgi:hypothetical protein
LSSLFEMHSWLDSFVRNFWVVFLFVLLCFDLIEYPQLISLTIADCQLSMTDLEILLLLTPSLVHLDLVSSRSTFDSIFDGSYWEQFIQNNLPFLNKFQFFFTYNANQYNPTISFDLLILPFRSPFWLSNKHWFVTCDYIPGKSKTRLYITPTHKIDAETRAAIFEVSSTNPMCRCILHSKKGIVNNTEGQVSRKSLSHIRMIITQSSQKFHAYDKPSTFLLSHIFAEQNLCVQNVCSDKS